MSDHIAHLGICDDTFRLAARHPAVHPRFKQLFDTQREAAHLGSVTRKADQWTVQVVGWAADQHALPPDDRDPRLDEKLAFTLGSLTHRSADRLTKPITNCWRGTPDAGPTGGDANESKIMQDLFVFREVYAGGSNDEGAALFSPAVLHLPDTDAAAGTELVFRSLLRRALIAMHTINSDPAHVHDWLDALFAGLQRFPKSLDQYTKLDREWDPAKVKKYLTDKRFYGRDDPLIVLARTLQHGGDATGDEIAAAQADTDRRHSRYARALAKALDYLVAGSQRFDGAIGDKDTAERFDIGVPELSIQD
ncbi:MAG: hypothetical protein AAF800_08745 [Planctomycetota bacterium]